MKTANDLFDLTGKKALVTGSSRGIGKAIALAFAAQGADVGIHGVGHAAGAADLVREIERLGRKSFCIPADLIAEDCAETIWKSVEEEFGGVDILVLNASIQYRKSWREITASDFNDQMNVNVRSSMLLIQKAVPFMERSGWGRILTIGSTQEIKPHPDMLVYSASKAAQALMARSLAMQLADKGITVNNLAPGAIHTDRNVEALSDAAYRQKIIASIPVGFVGETKDCVGAALLLCSDAGRYITGENLIVDGGKAFQ
jgi:NAD(P)-dependent dehydrogenase (short-subunit alcohol dehydrogenase family)